MNEPTTLRLHRRPIADADYQRHAREEGDYSTLIKVPTIVVDDATGEVVLVYLVPIEEDCRVLVNVLRHMDIPLTDRMGGMESQWRTFGSRPPNPYRHLPCGIADLAREDPHAHAVLCSYARVVNRYYQRYGPAVYARAERKVRQIRPRWQLEQSPFTSGIVNKDGELPYHYDKTNFKHVWSGMIGLKQEVKGGYLSVPAYNLAVAVADKSLTLFDGQSLLHGVTPMTVGPAGFRYTVVFYSRAGLVKCLRPGEEVQRRR